LISLKIFFMHIKPYFNFQFSVNGLSVNGLSVNGLSVNRLSVNGLSVNRPGPYFSVFLINIKMFRKKSQFLLIYQSAQLKLSSDQSSSQLSSAQAQVSWNIGQLSSSLGSSSSAQAQGN
jgi:hypothetical protein